MSWRLEPSAYIVLAFDTVPLRMRIVARATFPDEREDVHPDVVLEQLPQRAHRFRQALVTYNVAYGVTAHGPLLVACLGVHG